MLFFLIFFIFYFLFLFLFFFYKLIPYLRYKNTFTNKQIFKKEKIVLLLLLLTYILLLDSICRYLSISNNQKTKKKKEYMVLQLICSLCSRYMAFYWSNDYKKNGFLLFLFSTLDYFIFSRRYLYSTFGTNSFKEMDFSFSLFEYK